VAFLSEANVVDVGEKCKRILPLPDTQSTCGRGIGVRLDHTIAAPEHGGSVSQFLPWLQPDAGLFR
jgi:hypothetical protein